VKTLIGLYGFNGAESSHQNVLRSMLALTSIIAFAASLRKMNVKRKFTAAMDAIRRKDSSEGDDSSSDDTTHSYTKNEVLDRNALSGKPQVSPKDRRENQAINLERFYDQSGRHKDQSE
jgi:hypothetical protein